MRIHLVRVHEYATYGPGRDAGAPEMHAIGTAGLHVSDDLHVRVAAVNGVRNRGRNVFAKFRDRAFGRLTEKHEFHILIVDDIFECLFHFLDGRARKNPAINRRGRRLRQCVFGVTCR